MIIPIHQIPIYAQSDQQGFGKYDLVSKLVNSDNRTKGLDIAKFNLEKNNLGVKFPHKIQGDLIKKLAEKRIETIRTLDEQLTYVQVSLDSKDSLSKLDKFKVTGYDENFAILHVSEKEISELALIDSVKTIGLPDMAEKLSHMTSEGVSFMGADQMRNAGYTGNGIKVAVIDGGVDPTDPEFSARVAYSHLYDSSNLCAGSIACGDSRHGDAVSEIIVDMAPNVSLYLYTIGNSVDFGNAVDDAISKNVDVISSSVGFPGQGSVDTVNFRDGHSPVAKKINQASDVGILPVIAAGNEGKQHWKGAYSASPSIANSLGLNTIGYESVHVFNPTASGNLQACLPVTDLGDDYFLSWNNWPTTNQDYDFLLFDSTLSIFYDGSFFLQDGSLFPLEFIPQGIAVGSACLVIASYSSNQNASFHLYTNFNDLNDSFEVRAGSISTPADATGALAVGAVNVSTNTLKDYSTSGPTDDNRNKPEVCGATDVLSHQYPTFGGTSAATPHVAGAAALILEQNPLLTVSQLKSKITGNVISSTYSVNNLCGANSGVTNLDSLATPHNLVATTKSATEIDLSWSSYNTATGYKIERESPIGGGFSTLAADTGTTATIYSNSGLTGSTLYNYRVSAIIPSGTTNPSSGSSATTSAATAPLAITNLTALSGDHQITLSWTAPNNGGSPNIDYIIQYKLSTSLSYTTFPDGISATTGGTVTGLTNGLSYDFKVSAVNAVGTSLASNVVSALPPVICTPPVGNWVIASSCKIIGTITATGDVSVQDGALVTIENGGTLNIDFTHFKLLVKSGSGVLIKSGGKIFTIIYNVAPATNAFINSITAPSPIHYTLSENIVSGSIVMTRTGGNADGASPHTCTLKGTALNSGVHANLNLSDTTNVCTVAQSLVSGTVYTFTFSVTDATSGTATVSKTGITFDNTAPNITSVTPASSSTINGGFSASYTLSEAASSGSITFTQTGGAADVLSPHIYNFASGDKSLGPHSISRTTLETGFGSLVDGAIYTMTVSATDFAFNVSTPVTKTLITYDTSPPTITAVTPASNSIVNGSFSANYTLGEAVTLGSINFTRTGGSSDPLTHFYNFTTGDNKTAGQHSIPRTVLETGFGNSLVSNANYTMTVSATDAALNTGTINNTLITYDITSPNSPVITTASGTTADNTPTIDGTTENGPTVEIFDGIISLGFATVTGTDWTFTSPLLSDATHSITAKATDSALNTSLESNTLSLTVDTTVAPPVITTADGTTNDNTPDIIGTTEANTTVELFDGVTSLGSALVIGTDWTFTSPTLSEGIHSITAKATDAVANLSADSNVLSLTINTSP